jgi:hypothetical protein
MENLKERRQHMNNDAAKKSRKKVAFTDDLLTLIEGGTIQAGGSNPVSLMYQCEGKDKDGNEGSCKY